MRTIVTATIPVETSYTISVPHVVHDPNGETHFLPAGTRIVVATPQQVEAAAKVAEVSALIDANKMGEARALLNEIAAALGEGNVDVIEFRAVLHLMNTTKGTPSA